MRPVHSGRGRGFRLALLGLIAIGLAAVAAFAAGCGEESATSATVDTGGKLNIRETMYDFGPVPVGQKVEHKFVIENKGTGPLSIGKLSVKRLEGC